MAHDINWFIENELIYIRYHGFITSTELEYALTAQAALVQQSPRKQVHIISDLRLASYHPNIRYTLRAFREFDGTIPAGWEIMIGKLDKITALSMSLSRSFLRQKTIAFHTLDEAITHLKREDKQLNWDYINATVL